METKESKPKAVVIRWGAFGDAVQITPVFRLLKRDGYEVHFHCTTRGEQVTRYNPHIDKWILWPDPSPWWKCVKEWRELYYKYDRYVNLTGTIENTLLLFPKQSEYHLPKDIRHQRCNINYMDATLKNAGYGHITGLNGELFFHPDEDAMAKKWMKRNGLWDKWVILWSLSGTAFHKVYPWAEYVAKRFLDKHKDVAIITVGDKACEALEWKHERTLSMSGRLSWRKAMILTKMTDCVIGTETGILNAAGCYATPKVTLLSHSTPENLTKYWKNNIDLHANPALAPCYPCHQLHYERGSCFIETNAFESGAPICMAYLEPQRVEDALETHYQRFKHMRRR